MAYDKVISLGLTCAPAAHIRDYFPQPEAYFFDWLITQHDPLVRTLEADFAGLLVPQNLSVDEKRMRVIDAANGLQYQHDFPKEAEIIIPDFSQSADKVRDKYEFLARRTKDLFASGANLLMVRFTKVDRRVFEAEYRRRITSLLSEKYPRSSFSFLWITELVAEPFVCDDGFVFPIPKLTDWKGAPEPWGEAFRFAGALL